MAPPLQGLSRPDILDYAKPKLIVAGDGDAFAHADEVRAVVERMEGEAHLRALAGADHFMGGYEADIAGADHFMGGYEADIAEGRRRILRRAPRTRPLNLSPAGRD